MDTTQDGTYKALEDMLCDEVGEPLRLTLHLLQAITNNFSKENLIGWGGYGEVYRGVLGNGFAAVKKLYSAHVIGDETFEREVNCLMRIRHENIVLFVGYCSDTQKQAWSEGKKFLFPEIQNKLLCFKYLHNGSLSKHLTVKPCALQWPICYRIIEGICQGLSYLHERHIVHLDLKPENILLDDGMVPKIADFGLSRLLEGSCTFTTSIRGTRGYMAPEYIHIGAITVKADIYSLGVIIGHMVQGRNMEPTSDQYILKSWKTRLVQDLPLMSEAELKVGYQQIKACIEISQRCTQREPEDRPFIHEILCMLERMKAARRPTPNVQLQLAKFGPWGGAGGKPRDIKMAPCRLDSVEINSGDIIDSIQFSYTDHNGQYHTEGPWGGYGGTKNSFNLGPSEFLVGLSGSIGTFGVPEKVITSLTFVTNARSYGPFGGGHGRPFHIQIQSNGCIVGFFGHSGRYLEAIGIYTDKEATVSSNGPWRGDGGVLHDITIKPCHQLRLSKLGPWGGDEGVPQDIETQPYRLESITIRSGVIIDSIEFSYSEYNGMYHTIGPWGGHGGGKDSFNLGHSEFLVGVSGSFGPYVHQEKVVTSLMFVTNARSYGPFGQGRGTHFHIPMQSNGRIIGFFGRADRYLNAIGVYTDNEDHNGYLNTAGPSAGCVDRVISVPQLGLSKFGPWGGDGGDPQDIKILPYRLENITISSGVIINSIEFSYTAYDGLYHTSGPWGCHGGNNNSFNLGPLEFLVGISGSIGPFGSLEKVITSLMFVTNARSYGPFGEGQGTHFHIPMHSNGCIVGFFGRAGLYLNAIGVYTNHELETFGFGETQVARLGPWGGDGGVLHDITVTPHRLERVTVFCGHVIDSLEFVYSDHDGNRHTGGPWGGTGGGSNKIPSDPSEFIVQVSGTFRPDQGLQNVLSSLTLVTNTGRSYGPYGTEVGTAFHVPVQSNSRIVGFFAHGENFIEAIGVYVRTL